MLFNSFIAESLKDVSLVAKAKFGKVAVTHKLHDNNQILTEADTIIGQMLIEKIKNTFPGHNIFDEEAGVIDNNSEYTWVIDPIDGTSNFASAVPTFGILLGLIKNNTPFAGGMSIPYFDELYIAQKDDGAYLNGNKLELTTQSKLSDILLAYGIDGHAENPAITQKECELLSRIVLNIRNLRTSNSAYDIALLAKGSYGAVLNQTSKIWDNVAPQIIIEEAGGLYTDFNGKKLDYSNPVSKADKNFKFTTA